MELEVSGDANRVQKRKPRELVLEVYGHRIPAIKYCFTAADALLTRNLRQRRGRSILHFPNVHPGLLG